MSKKSGIVSKDDNPDLKIGDKFYQGDVMVGEVKLVLTRGYLVEFEPFVKVVEATMEETADAVDKGLI